MLFGRANYLQKTHRKSIKFPRYQAPLPLYPTCPKKTHVVPALRTSKPSKGKRAVTFRQPSTHATTSTTALCLFKMVSLTLKDN